MTTRDAMRPDDDRQALHDLASGRVPFLWRDPQSGWSTCIDPAPRGLLSGAFNPRHVGHDGLRDAAEAWLGGPVYFELPLINADKPALDVDGAVRRCRQFRDHPLLVTRAATFIEKARILPGVTFVVGADTADRIVAPRFYARHDGPRGARTVMHEALSELSQLACRFLVAARRQQGLVLNLVDVPVPDEFRELFRELPEDRFLLDVSSSDLRRADGGHS